MPDNVNDLVAAQRALIDNTQAMAMKSLETTNQWLSLFAKSQQDMAGLVRQQAETCQALANALWSNALKTGGAAREGAGVAAWADPFQAMQTWQRTAFGNGMAAVRQAAGAATGSGATPMSNGEAAGMGLS